MHINLPEIGEPLAAVGVLPVRSPADVTGLTGCRLFCIRDGTSGSKKNLYRWAIGGNPGQVINFDTGYYCIRVSIAC
jgi:hypothetical protein